MKATMPGMAGYTVEMVDDEPLLLPASPLQYLFRLRLQNHLFGDDVRMEGISTPPVNTNAHRILTSQPNLSGDIPDLYLIDYLITKQYGYRRLNIPPMG